MAGNQTFNKIGGIGEIRIHIYNSSQDVWQAVLEVDVKDSQNKPILTTTGQLADYLTNGQETALITFLNALRAKAQNELL